MSGKRDPIGLSDIRLHIPTPGISLDEIVERRSRQDPKLQRHLERALRTTGQKAIRFPEPWQDTATMAAQASLDLFRENPSIEPGTLRHLAVGTESGLDHSKPLSAYVQGMLQRAGVAVPASLSSFQSQHACAGGTVALLSVAGMLSAAGRPGDSGLVISSDIACYQSRSTAEVTQGAGAVALHVESSPSLLELDLAGVGYHSMDVDDFFRPLGATVPSVNGGYSMRCYEQSLDAAFLDHCARSGTEPRRELRETDFFVLHTPFHDMPLMAMEKLLGSRLGLDPGQARGFLETRGFFQAIEPLSRIGNLYTASMYAALAFLLDDRWRAMGDAIVGKRILLASYGSGNTMMVIPARIAEEAPEVIARWDLDRVFGGRRAASFEEYEGWVEGAGRYPALAPVLDTSPLPPDAFFLAGIRKDGYREYGKTDAKETWTHGSAEADDVRELVAAMG